MFLVLKVSVLELIEQLQTESQMKNCTQKLTGISEEGKELLNYYQMFQRV